MFHAFTAALASTLILQGVLKCDCRRGERYQLLNRRLYVYGMRINSVSYWQHIVWNCRILLLLLLTTTIIIITANELSLGGSSPYTSTGKTNKNKYT